jgi:hypothetical protein
MKEILKKDLMKQLIESYTEVDEMAAKDIDKTTWNALYSEPQDDSGEYRVRGDAHLDKKGKGEHIGHKIVDKTTGEHVYIIYPCDSKIDEFISKHKSALEAMKELYGDLWIRKDESIPCREPRTTVTPTIDVFHMDSDEKRSVNTKVKFEKEISDANYIKRYMLYPLIKNVLLGDGTIQNHLEKCSLPKIKVDDRANLDRHSTFSNSILTYQTLNFNSYKNVRDFFNATVRNVQGIEPTEEEKDYREYHLARQFNKVYNNWEKTKKNTSVWNGFTPIYNLEVSGYASQPFDVTVSSLLTIKGNLEPNGYKWSVEFTTEHGKNLKDSSALGRINKINEMKLAKDYELKSEEVVNGEIQTSSKDSLVKNLDVKNGFIKCLENIKQQILQIPIQDQLKRSKIVRFELTPEEKEELKRQRQERLSGMNQSQGEEQPELNESLVNSIVQNILTEIKDSYETYHDSYTSAINAAKSYAEKKGYEINDDDSFSKIGMGPRKPQEGKTNRFSIELSKDGKVQKKHLHIQVYGMKSKYELNAYIS